MLKSLCVKTNNQNIINYLLDELEHIKLNNIYISKLKFSKYTNIVVHYKGNNIQKFINTVSEILSAVVLKFYEKKIIKHLLYTNYFYFTNSEQLKILEICKNNLNYSDENDVNLRKEIVKKNIKQYFSFNKSLILSGFVNFRLNNYFKILDSIVDSSVNKFVVDREYLEFINLLKTYIASKECGLNIVHLIYNKQESILLDEFKDTINLENNILDTKYISDITFSSNDYALNNLLTLLPKKIYIHLVNSYEDEFINTLKLIFENRIYICTECDICKLYSLNTVHK